VWGRDVQGRIETQRESSVDFWKLEGNPRRRIQYGMEMETGHVFDNDRYAYKGFSPDLEEHFVSGSRRRNKRPSL
jgi:hypothetical protein